MFRVNKAAKIIASYSALLPITLSLIGAIKHSSVMILLLPVSLFITVALTPLARKQENIWMFLLVAASGIPVNLFVIRWFLGLSVLESHFFLLTFFRGLALYIMLLSMEELILGIITRMIWKKQYKISFSKNEQLAAALQTYHHGKS